MNKTAESEIKFEIDPSTTNQIKEKTKKCLVSLRNPSEKAVVYLGRIPHGFYEEEMESYFSQFGSVCRLRLSRNKKTGKSKHYAFIEFASKEVADIVAETMDNYLMFNHQLVCKVLKPEQVNENLFKGANQKFKVLPRHKMDKQLREKPKTLDGFKKCIKKLVKKENEKRLKLKELGISYSFPGIEKVAQSVMN